MNRAFPKQHHLPILAISATLLLCLGAATHGELLSSQNLLNNEPPQLSGLELNLVPFAQVSDKQILSTYSPAHDRRSRINIVAVVDVLRGSPDVVPIIVGTSA